MKEEDRYLLMSRDYGFLGQAGDVEEMAGLMLARAAFDDMVYVMDQKTQRYATFRRCQWGVEQLSW